MEKQKNKTSASAKGRSHPTSRAAKKSDTSSKSKATPKSRANKAIKKDDDKIGMPDAPPSNKKHITNSDEQKKLVNSTENSYDEDEEEMEEGTYLKRSDKNEDDKISKGSSSNHSGNKYL